MILNTVYLASRYSRYPEIHEYAKQLEVIGYKVVSRWHNGGHDIIDVNSETDKTRFALEDINDLDNAHTVINFTENPDESIPGRSRGGRHVEFGAVLAAHYLDDSLHRPLKKIIVVGYRENVFHWLPVVEFYPTWDECLNTLKERAERYANYRTFA